MNNISSKIPKPFLKWAGGKTQLLKDINDRLPADLDSDYSYFEPFVGGGAVFFDLMKKYNFKYAYLSDINKDLILTYNIIKEKPARLISVLNNFKQIYTSSKFDNKEFFYHIRDLFNAVSDFDPLEVSSANISRAAQMIFLNKTCFNGLYRVNKKGKFNVPFANPKNPLICDKDNIYAVSEVLQNVELVLGDFSDCESKLDEKSFVYLDPPYKPVNGKKSFEGYTKDGFDDLEQKRLSDFCKNINDNINGKFLLSNSKPAEDCIFNELYQDFTIIDTVSAKRAINSNGKKRGEIDELLIYNCYEI